MVNQFEQGRTYVLRRNYMVRVTQSEGIRNIVFPIGTRFECVSVDTLDRIANMKTKENIVVGFRYGDQQVRTAFD